jgi:hypothetical protein
MVEILKKYNFPRKIIKELINKNNGAFRANFKNQYIPSRAWEYAAYMHFYKKSLKIWTSIPSI